MELLGSIVGSGSLAARDGRNLGQVHYRILVYQAYEEGIVDASGAISGDHGVLVQAVGAEDILVLNLQQGGTLDVIATKLVSNRLAAIDVKGEVSGLLII